MIALWKLVEWKKNAISVCSWSNISLIINAYKKHLFFSFSNDGARNYKHLYPVFMADNKY